MGRSHKVWVDVTGGSGKSFGCGKDDIQMKICVGTSGSTSKRFSTIKICQHESDGKIYFELLIDGQRYRTESIDVKTKEYKGIKGYRINGTPKLQKKRETDNAASMLRMTANVAALGEILAGDSKKEKNDWKKRMLVAGLENKGLIMPADWDQLSEDDKEKRLNGVIEVLREEPKK
jgi:hypothetical protein